MSQYANKDHYIATLESEVAAYKRRAETAEAALAAIQPAQPVSDERIEQIYDETAGAMGDDFLHAGWLAFARALLREAQPAAPKGAR